MTDWTDTQLLEVEDFFSNMEWKVESHEPYPTITNLDFQINNFFKNEDSQCKIV